MKISGVFTLPLIKFAIATDPFPSPWKVKPVAVSKGGPSFLSKNRVSDPAYITETGPDPRTGLSSEAPKAIAVGSVKTDAKTAAIAFVFISLSAPGRGVLTPLPDSHRGSPARGGRPGSPARRPFAAGEDRWRAHGTRRGRNAPRPVGRNRAHTPRRPRASQSPPPPHPSRRPAPQQDVLRRCARTRAPYSGEHLLLPRDDRAASWQKQVLPRER